MLPQFALVAVELLWLPQAAAAAYVLSALAEGKAAMIWQAVALFAIVGMMRPLIAHAGRVRLDNLAEAEIARLRKTVLQSQDRHGSHSRSRLPSATAGALILDKLALLKQETVRYRPVRWNVIVVPLAILALSAWMSWVVALAFAISGPLIPVFMALVGLAAKSASERHMSEIGSLNALVMERLHAMADIRLLDATDRVIADFTIAAQRLRQRTMAVLRVAFLSSAVMELFAALGVAMVAVYVGLSLLGRLEFGAWSDGLSMFEGIYLLMLAPAFYQPMRDLAAAWHDQQGASVVHDEIAVACTDTSDRMIGEIGGDIFVNPPDTLSISGLVLAGSGAHRITCPDIELQLGQSIALSGPSGSGKSTCLASLCGLVRPLHGDIRFGGTLLDENTADACRQYCSFVPQQPFFFSGTLRHNLMLAAPDASDATLWHALDTAHAGSMVQRLPGGLDAELGEAGSGVSGGEARRLMIARAILENRPLLLMDEPTANLDAKTAALIRKTITALIREQRMVIVATHDPDLLATMGGTLQVEDTCTT
ncbi:hypothetical protein BMG03_20610 (plasmid) [Thioclava nitratireducens]|uniref:Thiol reductant ABC exporter subunit CydD n=1 Tax=Thioclava nitratireducens TaxID=1915078 RepID=A0ABN4XD86_9RHOB|nr:hypothetical protein BMG03_20610 [Thioclava nitratireducens]